jgi:hypothetical protein
MKKMFVSPASSSLYLPELLEGSTGLGE